MYKKSYDTSDSLKALTIIILNKTVNFEFPFHKNIFAVKK